MESPVRNSIIIGVVLIALSIVIILCFSAFSISKGTANEGVVESQSAVNNFESINYNQFEDKIVTGRDVISIFRTLNDKTLSIFVHTKKMEEGKNLSLKNDRYIQYCNSIPYVNYGAILSNGSSTDIEDLILVRKNDNVPSGDDSLYLKEGRVNTEGSYCIDSNGKIYEDNSVGDWRNNSAVEYIDENTKFDANLIYDISGEIIGICFTQI